MKSGDVTFIKGVNKMPYELPEERIGMPTRSNVSINSNLNTFSKKHLIKQFAKKNPILGICVICGKSYDKTEKAKLLANLPSKLIIDHSGECLNCIKESCQNIKESYRPDLVEAKESLEELTITYQNAHNHYKALSAKYQKYDYIAGIIHHHLTKPAETPKAGKTRSNKTPDQIKKETALKILASLTEEQRTAILATMAKEQTL